MKHMVRIGLASLACLAPSVHAQDFQWVKHAESMEETAPTNIVADGRGHVYVGGCTKGPMTFDGVTFSNPFGVQSFLARFDEDGTRQWMAMSDCPYPDYISYIGLDTAREHVYVTGGRLFPGGSRGPLLYSKYDTAGTLLWERTIDSETGARTGYLAVQDDGTVVATASTLGAARVDGVPHPQGFFTTMLDSGGHVRWYRAARSDPAPICCTAKRIVTDRARNIYVVGVISTDSVDLDGVHLLHPGDRNRMFLIKYDEHGTIGWVRQSGGGEAHARCAAVDRDGNILVTGFLHDTVDFGGHVLAGGGERCMFIVTFDSAGTVLRTMLVSGADGYGITPMADGAFHVVGEAAAHTRFGDVRLPAAGAFVARYGAGGSCERVVAAFPTSGASDAEVWTASGTSDGKVFLTGQSLSECSFHPFLVPGGERKSLFVARVANPALDDVRSGDAIPDHVALRQNYPNPFMSTTMLPISLLRAGRVAVDVTDALGRCVRRVFTGDLPAGAHALRWDSGDLPPGAYFARLQAGGVSVLRLMTKL